MLPNVYVPSSSAWNNTDYNIGDYNHLLWGIRMRQARSKSPSNLDDCKVPSSIQDAEVLTVDSCARRYSAESRDTVGFGGRTTTNRQLYIWSSANDNQGKVWSGSNLMEVYDADGYVVDLPLNRTFATNKVATMQCNPIENVSGILLYDEELADRSVCAPFIDGQTRAIFLLIQVYNPNLNIFGRLETMVEFSVSGDVSAKVSHHTAALIPDDTSAVEASKKGVNWTLIVIMLLDFFWYVGTCRRQVCVAVGGISVWVLLDLTLFVLYGIHIVDTFKETFDYTKTEVMDALNRDSYSDLNTLFEQRQTIRVIFAVTLILMMVRLFKYLKYISGLEVVFKTLVRAGVDILWFMLLFVGILFAFVFGGYITFGHESEDHRTFEESLLTTIRWTHNDVNLDVFLAETGVPGIIYYMCSVLFFYFILVNMLIAILLTAWSIEKKLWLEKVEKSQTVQLLPDWQRSLRNLVVYIFCGCLLGRRNVWSDTASAVTNPLRTFRKIQRIYREHQVEIPPQEVMDRLMQWHARKQNTRIEFLDFIHIRNAMKGGQRNMRLVTDFQVRTIMALCENDPTRDTKYMFTTEEKNAEIKAKLEKQVR